MPNITKDLVADNISNTPEFTVSELAFSLKRTVEDTFGHVRVRGELGRVTVAKSGHCYLDIKDDKAVINSIVWKGVMNRLSMRPEEGMEVVCEGKLSTYPGRSNYQLIIDKMELAGAGALMALFEKRKKMFAAEGLFDAERKRELPFMPKTVGVVTSPTGAVIRDILHRIMDRFPVHVIVWPVLVQGDKAADQISAAITGFNHGEGFPRPDLLIVARGGGSMEDLWCFNEENVVRAAANSKIPLISAIGHETDWTLIDFVVDYRAPTPTGAGEKAVPVQEDWLETIADYGLRLSRGLKRNLNEKKTALSAAKLPKLEGVVGTPRQRLDLAIARLPRADRLFEKAKQNLAAQRLPNPKQIIEMKTSQLNALRLRPDSIRVNIDGKRRVLQQEMRTANSAIQNRLQKQESRLLRAAKLLDAYSYQGVLERGYALVQNKSGDVVRSKDDVQAGEGVTLTFEDGKRGAVIEGKAAPKAKRSSPKKLAKKPSANNQQDLF